MAWSPGTTDPRGGATSSPPSRAVMAGVFGEAWSSETAFARIEQGLRASAVKRFVERHAFERETVLDVLKISQRTFERRLREGRLRADESDRFYRLVGLVSRAADVLGGAEEAAAWMTRPAAALGDRAPLEYARNDAGAQRVEDLLDRIEYGVYG